MLFTGATAVVGRSGCYTNNARYLVFCTRCHCFTARHLLIGQVPLPLNRHRVSFHLLARTFDLILELRSHLETNNYTWRQPLQLPCSRNGDTSFDVIGTCSCSTDLGHVYDELFNSNTCVIEPQTKIHVDSTSGVPYDNVIIM